MTMPIRAALAALALAALSGPALAANDVPTRMVSTAAVDFQDRAAVDALYVRMQQAARDVCDTNSANPRITQGDAACADRALAKAVREIDHPTLTASYNQRHTDARLANTARADAGQPDRR
jgi:UrcA family protein